MVVHFKLVLITIALNGSELSRNSKDRLPVGLKCCKSMNLKFYTDRDKSIVMLMPIHSNADALSRRPCKQCGIYIAHSAAICCHNGDTSCKCRKYLGGYLNEVMKNFYTNNKRIYHSGSKLAGGWYSTGNIPFFNKSCCSKFVVTETTVDCKRPIALLYMGRCCWRGAKQETTVLKKDNYIANI